MQWCHQVPLRTFRFSRSVRKLTYMVSQHLLITVLSIQATPPSPYGVVHHRPVPVLGQVTAVQMLTPKIHFNTNIPHATMYTRPF